MEENNLTPEEQLYENEVRKFKGMKMLMVPSAHNFEIQAVRYVDKQLDITAFFFIISGISNREWMEIPLGARLALMDGAVKRAIMPRS